MLNNQKYTVQIAGESYVLLSDETPEQLERSVVCLDQLLREITQSTTVSSPQKAAVLVALRLQLELQAVQHELLQTQQALQQLITRLEAIQ